MVRVFVQGSFDIFHAGHLRFLEQAKAQGDYLIVGINTDRLYRQYKGKEPVVPFKYRKEVISGLKCVDEVIPASNFSPIKILKEYDIDVYVIYSDWKGTKMEEISYMKSKAGKVVILKGRKILSSRDIKRKL